MTKIPILGAFILFGSLSFSQSIYFNYTDGSTASYSISDVRKVTFTADVMNLHLWDGTVYSWNVSTIGHYEYSETSGMEELLNLSNTFDVCIFPNPASTNLNVQFKLLKEDLITLSLFDVNGNLVIEKNLGKLATGNHQETLDLLKVPQGNYVCLISGQQNSITKQVVKQ
jgi:hypothetical protein